MYKKLLFFGLTLTSLSGSVFANCNDKCISRNPLNGSCMLEVRVCDLSKETVDGAIDGLGVVMEGGTKWLGGASLAKVQEAFGHVDPVKALTFYAQKSGVSATIDERVTSCLVDSAAVGILGPVCAAGMAELGAYCLADLTCTSTCVGTGSSFKSLVENCAGLKL